MSQENRNAITPLFIEFCDKYKISIINPKIIPVGSVITPNWACVLNKPNNIGVKGVTLVTNDAYSIVQFIGEDANMDFYRNEDLTVLEDNSLVINEII